MVDFEINVFPHTSQTYGRSPVCNLLWIAIGVNCVKVCPQISQLKQKTYMTETDLLQVQTKTNLMFLLNDIDMIGVNRIYFSDNSSLHRPQNKKTLLIATPSTFGRKR